ncbi:MAG: 1-acyl-sn-glycerol-3-phosphate acyltransferase [Chloroflexi bacterium]|nr:1-acyl-sn-glycerol-3-phosphate acyltransferase [Chloroflexota bacterium]
MYPVCNFLERMLLRALADYKVTGKEYVPQQGPLIVVANHQSNMDPPLLGASIPRRVWFLAKDGIFTNWAARWFLESYGAHSLNREAFDPAAMKWVLRKLEHGEAVAIFPEGTRSRGEGMQRAMPGVARIALRTQAPLLPIGITGTERLGTWARVVNPTGTLRVNIGRVFSLPDIEGKPTPELLDSLTTMIMRRVAELLPEGYQGHYRIPQTGLHVPSND